MNPVRTIIKFISEMDSDMLSEVLSNDITYQEAHKEVFV